MTCKPISLAIEVSPGRLVGGHRLSSSIASCDVPTYVLLSQWVSPSSSVESRYDLRCCVCLVTGLMLLFSSTVTAEPAPPPETARRLAKPFTISYHSHWLLLGGLRVAYRVLDGRTELNALVGSAVVTGCGIQAEKCEQAGALNVGVRRYLTDTPLTGYLGFNVHGVREGMRFVEGAAAFVDFSVGFNHQTSGGFSWGLGYSAFFFNGGGDAFDPSYNGWILSELGYAF